MNTSFLRTLAISAAAVASLSLGACAGMSPQARNTTVGAGVGAVAGQVITGSTGGAVAGAVIGGLIGNEEGKKAEGR